MPTPFKLPHFSLRVAFFLHALTALSAVILVNLFATQKARIYDYSATKDITLSERSINALKGVEQNMRIVVAVRRDHPLYQRVYDLASACDRVINKRINLDAIDPVRDPNQTNQLVEKINQTLREAAGNSVTAENLPSYQITGDKVLVISGESIQEIDITDMVQEEALAGERTVSLFRGEDLLISAILSATQPEPDVVGLVTGLGTPPGGLIASQRLTGALPYQNATLVPVDLESNAPIAENIKTLVFYGPQSDLSSAAAEKVTKYWNERQGGLVYFLQPGTQANLNNLLTLPKIHGILPRTDKIVRVSNQLNDTQVITSMAAPLAISSPWNPEWRKLLRESSSLSESQLMERAMSMADAATLSTIALPPQSLSLQLDIPKLRQSLGRATLTEVLTSPDGYWGEINLTENPPQLDPKTDTPGPLTIGAALDTDPKAYLEGSRSGRMVVIGNAHIISEPNLVQNNFDFVLNAINWSMARENLLGINSKRPEFFTFNLDRATNNRIELIYLLCIPACLLALAFFVHQARRK